MSLSRVALYQGSFNPLHDGHLNVIAKTLQMFDRVVVLIAVNPEKNSSADRVGISNEIYGAFQPSIAKNIEIRFTDGLVVNFVNEYNEENAADNKEIVAVVRGLRNTVDFEYEKAQQYWNEDLGLTVPIINLIAPSHLTHISSSALRALSKFKKEGDL
jgi:pantetheine-phosphate adenylyltransferase